MKKRNYKIIKGFDIVVIALLITAQSLSAYGQPPPDPEEVVSSILQQSVKLPQSPEAAAFMRYGEPQVNLYTGTPNIQVPIYTFKGREMDLPISLTYDATGIKIEQLAGQTGLGWNLNVGGRLSRVVNGLPDDITQGPTMYSTIHDDQISNTIRDYVNQSGNPEFDTEQQMKDYLDFLLQVHLGNIDTQPDYFSVNAPGLSEYIVYDLDAKVFRTLNNPRNAVNNPYNGDNVTSAWRVTGEDGTEYHFGAVEITESISSATPQAVPEYYSSWLLTRIESPNKKDIYEFTYTPRVDYWTTPPPQAPAQRSAIVADGDGSADNYGEGAGTGENFVPSYNIKQSTLSSIKHNDKVIVSVDTKSRLDFASLPAIDFIKIHDPFDGSEFRRFLFDYTYFGTTDPNAINETELEIRLKLDEIRVIRGVEFFERYRFEYIEPQKVPARDFLGQDYLGYNNNAFQNTTLLPAMQLGNDTYAGANRDPDFTFSPIGTLNKIIYPTGGYTTYTYEGNEVTAVEGGEYQIFQDHHFATVDMSTSSADPTCGIYCFDANSDLPFYTATHTFQITAEDQLVSPQSYDIDIINGTVPYAYLFEIPSSTPLKFDEIIDQNSAGTALVDFLWVWGGGLIPPSKISLGPGFYQLFLVSTGPNDPAVGQIIGDRRAFAHTSVVVEEAGFRIHNISSYTAEDEKTTSKTYQYTTEIDSDVTSEKQVYAPTLIRYSQTTSLVSNGIQTIDVWHRNSYAGGGGQPHIAYEKVFVIDDSVDPDRPGNNGYEEYTFRAQTSGLRPINDPPFANSYIVDPRVGQALTKNVYDNKDQWVEQNTFDYVGNSYFGTNGVGNRGFYVKYNSRDNYKYPRIYLNASGKYIYSLLPGEQWCYVSGALYNIGSSCDNIQPPSNCPDCYNVHDVAALELVRTAASGFHTAISYTVKQTRGTDGSTHTQRTDYTYPQSIDYLLRDTKLTDSHGDAVINRTLYPRDLSSEYGDLITANRLAVPVEQEVWRDPAGPDPEKRISLSKNYYDAFDDKILLSKVGIAKGDDDAEDRVRFDYDNDTANTLEASKVDDVKTVYIWGYDDALPVVQVQGSDRNAVETAVAAAINAMSGYSGGLGGLGNPLRDVYGLDNATEISKWAEFNSNLRNQGSLSAAMITTFTHNFLSGLTSQTDPNGFTTYYEYDGFGRLNKVRDHEDNILQEYEYHLVNND